MATRAVYTFTGFAGQPPLHLFLHHDGYPTGAAWRFAEALRRAATPADFQEAFLASQPAAMRLAAVAAAADAEYRYLLQLRREAPHATSALAVRCWRRLPGSDTWQPRCGPVPLAAFIKRFLPGEPL